MKTALVLVLMLTLVASVAATTAPIEYEDCTYKGVCHGWHCGYDEVCQDKETSVDVPETDLTPVETRLTGLETKDYGHDWAEPQFWKMMYSTGLDWFKGVFAQKSVEDARYYEQQEQISKLSKRVFACEDALGMTEGYN